MGELENYGFHLKRVDVHRFLLKNKLQDRVNEEQRKRILDMGKIRYFE